MSISDKFDTLKIRRKAKAASPGSESTLFCELTRPAGRPAVARSEAGIAIVRHHPDAFEVLLNATSMFNHANVRMPEGLDRFLRWLVVTPDMHRVHHSVIRRETDSNFGFNLPWWDRLFRTYRAKPQDGHQGMTVGMDRFRDPRELRLDRMLWQPLR